MTLSVKPFGCMPSSGVSDGVQSLITEKLPGRRSSARSRPAATARVNVYSRVQMYLFKARQAAQAEPSARSRRRASRASRPRSSRAPCRTCAARCTTRPTRTRRRRAPRTTCTRRPSGRSASAASRSSSARRRASCSSSRPASKPFQDCELRWNARAERSGRFVFRAPFPFTLSEARAEGPSEVEGPVGERGRIVASGSSAARRVLSQGDPSPSSDSPRADGQRESRRSVGRCGTAGGDGTPPVPPARGHRRWNLNRSRWVASGLVGGADVRSTGSGPGVASRTRCRGREPVPRRERRRCRRRARPQSARAVSLRTALAGRRRAPSRRRARRAKRGPASARAGEPS